MIKRTPVADSSISSVVLNVNASIYSYKIFMSQKYIIFSEIRRFVSLLFLIVQIFFFKHIDKQQEQRQHKRSEDDSHESEQG
ncbi:hypothetical protein CQW34_03504 [Bacteroides fragilis]|uniref:Transmembrane protein n=1 Tax=Bacteroides fragilis TaxID=817 RepID=A0A2M9V3F9_BACFG|nr:hypothetical protein CQW34_03504 [Bacteroides fragilis]